MHAHVPRRAPTTAAVHRKEDPDGLFRHRRDRLHRPLPRRQPAEARQADLRARAQGLARRSSTALRERLGRRRQAGHRRRRRPREAEPRRRRRRRRRSSRARSTTSSTSPRSTTSRRAPRRSRPPTSTARATRCEFAEAIDAGCFHHVSSIAAAGLYDGVFREDMFEEAEDLDHPYFKTKHDSEGDRAPRMQAAVPHLPARASSSATRRPARSTRSTARTTSSS